MPQLIPEGWLLSDIEKIVGKGNFLEYGDGLLCDKKVKIPMDEIRQAAALNPSGRVYITLSYMIPELESISDPKERDQLFQKRLAESGGKRQYGLKRRKRE